MAKIQGYLDSIKNALFGKDVRSSIYDGIDAINKEVESTTNRQEHLEGTFDQLVINSGNSNAELVDARVGENGKSYAKLGDRLDEVDSQLEHIEKEINSIQNLNKNLGIAVSLKSANYDENENLELYKKQALEVKELNGSIELVCFISVINENDKTFISPDVNNLIIPFINYCKDNDIKISLGKIHLVKTLSPSDHTPSDANGIKGLIKPLEGDENIWFSNYKIAVNNIVNALYNEGIKYVVIANENELISTNYNYLEYWKDLINTLKNTYTGLKIGYSLHVGEQEYFEFEKRYNRPTMLDYLDFIGINTYPSMSNNKVYDGTKKIEDMKKILSKNVDIISKLYKLYPSKEFLITETGSMGRDNSLNDPIDTSYKYNKNSIVQGLYIKLIIEELATREYVKGFYIWHIREPFSIINTEAENIVKEYYKRMGV